jgi:hypothetical protein
MSFLKTVACGILLASLVLCAIGCQTIPAPDAPNADQSPAVSEGSERIEAIDEALLIYVETNRQLPPTLEDLRSVAGNNIQLLSPGGKPYVYMPAGLPSPVGLKRMMVYDPDPLAGGRHWCILVSDFKPGGVLVSEVVDLSSAAFQSYLSSLPQ